MSYHFTLDWDRPVLIAGRDWKLKKLHYQQSLAALWLLVPSTIAAYTWETAWDNLPGRQEGGRRQVW